MYECTAVLLMYIHTHIIHINIMQNKVGISRILLLLILLFIHIYAYMYIVQSTTYSLDFSSGLWLLAGAVRRAGLLLYYVILQFRDYLQRSRTTVLLMMNKKARTPNFSAWPHGEKDGDGCNGGQHCVSYLYLYIFYSP